MFITNLMKNLTIYRGSPMSEPLISEIVDYLYSNYQQADAERLSGIKLIAGMAMHGVKPGQDYKAMIDKIAVFNGITKKPAATAAENG